MGRTVDENSVIKIVAYECGEFVGLAKEIEKQIKALPFAEPERKKGKWISKGYGEYRCSSCRNIVDLDEEILMSIKMFNYCPVCGADMRGEQK